MASRRALLVARCRQWRARRARVIGVLARAGVPRTWIADALDLSRSRVKAILRAQRRESADAGAPDPARPGGTGP